MRRKASVSFNVYEMSSDHHHFLLGNNGVLNLRLVCWVMVERSRVDGNDAVQNIELRQFIIKTR